MTISCCPPDLWALATGPSSLENISAPPLGISGCTEARLLLLMIRKVSTSVCWI